MNLVTTGNAGTMESNDIMITVEPSDEGGVQVDLTSSVYRPVRQADHLRYQGDGG